MQWVTSGPNDRPVLFTLICGYFLLSDHDLPSHRFQIANITARGKRVIIVGGTFYYIEALLFPAHMLASGSLAPVSTPGILCIP
jgi:hypothetical protein